MDDKDSRQGERYVSVVQNPETKLWVTHLGGREDKDWLATMCDMDSRLDHSYPIPLIVSDDWDPIKDAVEEVYGIEYLPVSHRPGRPLSASRFAAMLDLKYAQVMKIRDEHGNLKAIETRIVHGDPIDVEASLISRIRGASPHPPWRGRTSL